MTTQRSLKKPLPRPSRGRKRRSTGLPSFLRPLFWDYRFGDLSWKADRQLVIDRVLTRGPWKSICWLRRRLGDAALRQWILEREGRGLSPRQMRYWQLILKLPRAVVDSWEKRALENPWYRRTGS